MIVLLSCYDVEKLTFTVDEAGEMLGISRGTAYAAAKSGDLPTIRMRHRLLVPRAALLRLLEGEGRRPSGDKAA
jgi:excisionase family DNA binding protein